MVFVLDTGKLLGALELCFLCWILANYRSPEAVVFVLDTGNLLGQTCKNAVLDKHPAQGNSNTSSDIMRW